MPFFCSFSEERLFKKENFMLKSVLSEKTCGQCRNCCVFYSKSRWETPSVPVENAEKIRSFLKCETVVEENGNICKIQNIEGKT